MANEAVTWIACILLSTQLTANALGEVVFGDLKFWVPATQVGDKDGIPGS